MFVTEEVFRGAWFAFASLQSFGNEMQCPICGPEPSAVIFDGVTISFGKKQLKDTLKPPTVSDDYSPLRPCRSVPGKAAIPDKSLRSKIRKVITGRSLFISPEELGQQVGSIDPASDSDAEEEESGRITDKAIEEVVERIELLPEALQGLLTTNQFLGSLFHRYCGIQRLAEKRSSPKPMVHLFREVSRSGI